MALERGTRRLRDADIESPRLEARLLLEWSGDLDTAQVISNPDLTLGTAVVSRFVRAIEQRSAGCPVARIVGEKEFWGLAFCLSEETLVPRPDTETVVEAVLNRCAQPHVNWCGTICDLGTGSGAILISLLTELRRAVGTGVDISKGAIDCARRNGARHGTGDRITWIVGDYSIMPNTRFDIVVSNPPYIAETEFAGLSREVREFDPRRALNGGHDGLDAYRILADRLPDLLSDNAFAALELGLGQGEAVAALINRGGLTVERIVPDLAGIPRVLLCRLP